MKVLLCDSAASQRAGRTIRGQGGGKGSWAELPGDPLANSANAPRCRLARKVTGLHCAPACRSFPVDRTMPAGSNHLLRSNPSPGHKEGQ